MSLRALLQRRHSSKDSGQEPQGECHAKIGTLLPDDDVSCVYCHIHDYKKGKVKLVAYDCQKLTMVLLAMRLLFSESFHLPSKDKLF